MSPMDDLIEPVLLAARAELVASGNPLQSCAYLIRDQPALTIMFGFGPSCDRRKVSAALGWLGKLIGSEQAAFVNDMFVRYLPLDTDPSTLGEDGLTPATDPASIEALVVTRFQGADIVGVDHYPYGRDDQGVIVWKEPAHDAAAVASDGGWDEGYRRPRLPISGDALAFAVQGAIRALALSVFPSPLWISVLSVEMRSLLPSAE